MSRQGLAILTVSACPYQATFYIIWPKMHVLRTSSPINGLPLAWKFGLNYMYRRFSKVHQWQFGLYPV